MDVNYLGIDPDAKDFRQVRRFNIGKIYLINKRAGQWDEPLADIIASRFDVSTRTVKRCEKFALKCRHRGMILGTPYKCEWFETELDPEAHEARKQEGLKKSHIKGVHMKRTRKQEGKKVAIAYKGGKCSCCGIIFNGENAAIFDFHHRDPKTKELNLGQSMEFPFDILKVELDKCDMLCSNCHRLVHHGSKNEP